MTSSRKKIIITGGAGFVGSHLIRHLQKYGYDIVVIDRIASPIEGVETVIADLAEGLTFDTRLERPYAYIHLAGKNIFGRFTKKHKHEIYHSRIVGTQQLLSFIKHPRFTPQIFVGASAVGIYGDRGDELLHEASDRGSTFLSDVVHDWEYELLQARFFDMRTVVLRQGHIMGRGGFLQALVPSFNTWLGGPIGAGTQWLPWIHIHDLVNLYREAIENNNLEGVYNAVSGPPIQYKDMSRALAQALDKPHIFRIPRFLLAMVFGSEFAHEMTVSQRIVSHRLSEFNHRLQYTSIKACINSLYGT